MPRPLQVRRPCHRADTGSGKVPRIESRDIAGELEVLLGPVSDQRQLRPERLRNDVVGVPDERNGEEVVSEITDSGSAGRSVLASSRPTSTRVRRMASAHNSTRIRSSPLCAV